MELKTNLTGESFKILDVKNKIKKIKIECTEVRKPLPLIMLTFSDR